jgi:two-component system chemotaxis sensor kinase CheA
MDTSQYMAMFLAEAREHLEALNLAVVRLEQSPKDRPMVDQIFRIAHSLKGMSAAMGFAQIADLTHAMEDVFELLRQRGSGLTREAVDALLACLDALSDAIEAIDRDGQEHLDPASLIDRLRALVRNRTPQQQVERSGGAALPELPALVAAREAGARVLHVIATLEDTVMMPAVRAHMIFALLAENGELLGSVPAQEGLELFEGRQIIAWLASDRAEADIVALVARISDVARVDVAEMRISADSAVPIAPPVPIETPAPVEAPAPVEPPVAVEALAPGEPPVAVARPIAVPLARELAPVLPLKRDPAPAAAVVPDGTRPTRTVRVDSERLDALMHQMGELVIHRTAVEALTATFGNRELHYAVQKLTRSSQALQSMVMQVRMIPVELVFLRFPRLIRDLSKQLGKEVELELLGRDTELDRTVVDALGDPLVHLVRNAIDHGLETPEVRLQNGKPRVGKLQISARHAGGSVVIEVRDDGAGVDTRAVAAKALASGLIDAEAAEQLDPRGAVELLFTAGFSTAETANDVSGRGVGMDAVRAKIRELGGEVLIDSIPGIGTHAQIRLPLTLAIVSALQVDVAGAPFAIPLDRVERTLRLTEHTVRSVSGRRVLVLADGVVPLIEGARTFERELAGPHELAVIVRGQDRRLGLAVDQLVGQRELVTRPLPAIVSEGQPVSGGAVLADGQIALIIDCDALASGMLASGITAPASTPLAA